MSSPVKVCTGKILHCQCQHFSWSAPVKVCTSQGLQGLKSALVNVCTGQSVNWSMYATIKVCTVQGMNRSKFVPVNACSGQIVHRSNSHLSISLPVKVCTNQSAPVNAYLPMYYRTKPDVHLHDIIQLLTYKNKIFKAVFLWKLRNIYF